MLNTLKVTELKEMAKDAKVKNWWNLKKDELMEELYKNPHYGLIFDYMEDYEVSFEIAQDMVLEEEEDNKPITNEIDMLDAFMNRKPETIIDPFGNELDVETETKVISRNGIGVEIEVKTPPKSKPLDIELEDKQQEGEEPIMILSDFAYMYNFKTTKTRRILRDHGFDKNGGRWEWFKGDENVIEEIKEVLEKYV